MAPPSEPAAWSISFYTQSRAISVLWSCLYADWNISYKSFSLRWSTYCTQTIRSISLENKRQIGDWSIILEDFTIKNYFFDQIITSTVAQIMARCPKEYMTLWPHFVSFCLYDILHKSWSTIFGLNLMSLHGSTYSIVNSILLLVVQLCTLIFTSVSGRMC